MDRLLQLLESGASRRPTALLETRLGRRLSRAPRIAGSFPKWGALALALAACTATPEIDTSLHLRQEYARRIGAEQAADLVVPFELDEQIEGLLDDGPKPAFDDRTRVDQVLDFIFRGVDLEYSLSPTRSAVDTFRAREGNCLSFVNLFVGVARHLRMNPFYVEVTDYHRWNYRDGMLVSRGHIVAGLYVGGEFETFDFLPYHPKAYRSFRPIDDLTAAAHFHNNLGAEALMAGDPEEAQRRLRVALTVAPDFDKAINNLGVTLGRLGDTAGALETLQRGLEAHPGNVPMMSNLVRLYQQTGHLAEAEELASRIGEAENTNPFFFVYRAERALERDDTNAAFHLMRQALRRNNELPEVQLGMVKVFLAMGDLVRARHHLERALRLDATDPEARRYAEILMGLDPGRPTEVPGDEAPGKRKVPDGG